MIKNMLSMNDVESEIFGEHLQGGVGDLQASGIIRVMVADEDYSNARQIVADWEASQPPVGQEGEVKKVVGWGSALAGFIVGAVVVFLLLQSPITTDGIDYNNDGVLDQQWEFAGDLMRSINLDQNRDGEFDTIWRYDLRGLLETGFFDNDFDGRHEEECGFREGNSVWCRADHDDDGFYEYREGYRFGVLETVSMFDPASQALKKKQYFEAERLKRAEVDLDGDGVLETKYEYDEFEEIQ